MIAEKLCFSFQIILDDFFYPAYCLRMNRSFFNPMPVVLAHRGDSAFYPENTLPAFLSAEELGVDVIETDIHVTSDNKLVIWHDETLERNTNGSGTVESHTFKELRKLDAGYSFTNDNGNTHPFRDKGIQIISLEEALATLPKMKFNIDLKSKNIQITDLFCKEIRKMHAEDRVICASFHNSHIKRVREIAPEILTSLTRKEVTKALLLQKAHLPFSPKSLKEAIFQIPVKSGNIPVVTNGFVSYFHQRNCIIQVWTINDETAMQRLLKMGVDGIVWK